MLDRTIEHGLLQALEAEGVGCIAFSPLAQGVLTDRYLGGSIPADSRAAGTTGFLRPEHLTAEKIEVVRALNDVALGRGQTLAQLALSWVLRHPGMTSVLIGASRPSQILDGVKAAQAPALTPDLLARIDGLLAPLAPAR
jgi:L-glyceraldehyde 3-phosphate reductase